MFKRLEPKRKKQKQTPRPRHSNHYNQTLCPAQFEDFSEDFKNENNRGRKRRCNLTKNYCLWKSKSVSPSNLSCPNQCDVVSNKQKQVRFDHTAVKKKILCSPKRSPPPSKLKSSLKKASGDTPRRKRKSNARKNEPDGHDHNTSYCRVPYVNNSSSYFGSVYPFFSCSSGFSRLGNQHQTHSSYEIPTPINSELGLRQSDYNYKYSEYKLPMRMASSSNASSHSDLSARKFYDNMNRLPKDVSTYTSPFANISANKYEEPTPTHVISYPSSYSNDGKIEFPGTTVNTFTKCPSYLRDANTTMGTNKYRLPSYSSSADGYSSVCSKDLPLPNCGSTFMAGKDWLSSSQISTPPTKPRPYSSDAYLKNKCYITGNETNSSSPFFDCGFELRQMDQRKGALQKIRKKEPNMAEKFITNLQRTNSPRTCSSKYKIFEPPTKTYSSNTSMGLNYDYMATPKYDTAVDINFNKAFVPGAIPNNSNSPFSDKYNKYSSSAPTAEPSISQPWKDILSHTKSLGGSSLKNGASAINEKEEKPGLFQDYSSTKVKMEKSPYYFASSRMIGKPTTGYRELFRDFGISSTKAKRLEVNQVSDFLKEIDPLPKSDGSQHSTGLLKTTENHSIIRLRNNNLEPKKLATNKSKMDDMESWMRKKTASGENNAICRTDATEKTKQFMAFDFVKDEGERLEKVNAILHNSMSMYKSKQDTSDCNTDPLYTPNISGKSVGSGAPEIEKQQAFYRYVSGECKDIDKHSIAPTMIERITNLVSRPAPSSS